MLLLMLLPTTTTIAAGAVLLQMLRMLSLKMKATTTTRKRPSLWATMAAKAPARPLLACWGLQLSRSAATKLTYPNFEVHVGERRRL